MTWDTAPNVSRPDVVAVHPSAPPDTGFAASHDFLPNTTGDYACVYGVADGSEAFLGCTDRAGRVVAVGRS
jgi:hypothetical protein